MNRKTRVFVASIVSVAAILLMPDPAHAYGGPGSVISGLGALLAAVAAILVSIFGFLWFPLKRLIRKLRGTPEEPEPDRVEGHEQTVRE